MKVFFACAYLSIFVCCWALHLTESEWENFKFQYNKIYSSTTEEQQRKQIFLNNKEKVAAQNALYDKGLVTYAIGINAYSDRFPEEMAAMKGYRANPKVKSSVDMDLPDIDLDSDLPKSVDWRKKGAVTPVKDQGGCGSCWAFSAVGSLEGQHFLKTKKLVSLSEQNLVDCDRADLGCLGGDLGRAFEYIEKNGGIDTEASYNYTGRQGKCRFDPKHVGATCTGHKFSPKSDEKKLMFNVAKVGPISVAIDASADDFNNYKHGIYYNPNCSSSQLNHGVTLVGYGTTRKGKDYWIVKNSWGVSWGLKGYILMSRNRNNNCGIASDAVYPTGVGQAS